MKDVSVCVMNLRSWDDKGKVSRGSQPETQLLKEDAPNGNDNSFNGHFLNTHVMCYTIVTVTTTIIEHPFILKEDIDMNNITKFPFLHYDIVHDFVISCRFKKWF